jgi:hypothetical protein
MRVPTLRQAALAIALLFCWPPSSLLADATGWVEQGCTFTIFHITKNALPVGQELILRLHTELTPLGVLPLGAYLQGPQANTLLTVQGERCFRAGNCDEASRAAIWLDAMKGNVKSIYGRYAVDVGGQHVEGRFVVKYRKIKPLGICE